MIISIEPGNTANVIHLVSGIETDVMLDMHGVATIDISEILHKLDLAKPVLLTFSKVTSEVNTIGSIKATGMVAPFVAPLIVTDVSGTSIPKNAKVMPKPTAVKSDVSIVKGVCMLCLTHGDLVRIGNSPAICPSCHKINTGIKIKKGKHAADVARPNKAT
jgi:hypothetical protein